MVTRGNEPKGTVDLQRFRRPVSGSERLFSLTFRNGKINQKPFRHSRGHWVGISFFSVFFFFRPSFRKVIRNAACYTRNVYYTTQDTTNRRGPAPRSQAEREESSRS